MFGESVSIVGENLFNFGVKTLGQICSTSGLSVKVNQFFWLFFSPNINTLEIERYTS